MNVETIGQVRDRVLDELTRAITAKGITSAWIDRDSALAGPAGRDVAVHLSAVAADDLPVRIVFCVDPDVDENDGQVADAADRMADLLEEASGKRDELLAALAEIRCAMPGLCADLGREGIDCRFVEASLMEMVPTAVVCAWAPKTQLVHRVADGSLRGLSFAISDPVQLSRSIRLAVGPELQSLRTP